MVAQDKCNNGSDSVTKLASNSALYHIHYLDEKPSPDISLSFIGSRACDVLVFSPCARIWGAPCHGR